VGTPRRSTAMTVGVLVLLLGSSVPASAAGPTQITKQDMARANFKVQNESGCEYLNLSIEHVTVRYTGSQSINPADEFTEARVVWFDADCADPSSITGDPEEGTARTDTGHVILDPFTTASVTGLDVEVGGQVFTLNVTWIPFGDPVSTWVTHNGYLLNGDYRDGGNRDVAPWGDRDIQRWEGASVTGSITSQGAPVFGSSNLDWADLGWWLTQR
jgi:hypothetical protein